MRKPSVLPLGFSRQVVHAPARDMPAPGLLGAWGQVALRAERGEHLGDLAALLAPWRSQAAVRRLRLTAAGDPEDALGVVGTGIRVDWVVDREAASGLLAVAPSRWRPKGVIPWAQPAAAPGQDLLETVRLAGTAGWPVILPPDPEVLCGETPILSVLDFYLFHPGLAVPVEPLHSLLIGLLSRQPRTLWEIWFGPPLDRFYVDDDGWVSLCASWAARPSLRYGARDEPPEAWRASRAYASLRALLRGEERLDPACEACEVRGVCGGAILALQPAARCDVFREVMARLRLAAAALQRRHRGNAQASRPQSCS